jgi:cyclophilin family peptidyl-prolyl cis-trans isomerase
MGCGASVQNPQDDSKGLPIKEIQNWGHDNNSSNNNNNMEPLDSDEKDIINLDLKFEPLKELWTSEDMPKGKSLVLLKDCILSYSNFIATLYKKFAIKHKGKKMLVSEFVASIKECEIDLDDDTIINHLFEIVGYPEDEDDLNEISKISCAVGEFASALVRVGNSLAIQNSGVDNSGLRLQFINLLQIIKTKMGGELESIYNNGPDQSKIRNESFFLPPSDFKGTVKIVYLTLGTSENDIWGKVKIKLNTDVTPITSYNFYSLCTGNNDRIGELSNKPLTLNGSSFHRIVKNSFVQGGDITLGDGYGGESVYGGDYNDENFDLKHDSEGIVSSANNGPNTNSSQFFITTVPTPHLDNENVVFGNVIEGIEIVKRVATEVDTDEDDVPLSKIYILDCGEIL